MRNPVQQTPLSPEPEQPGRVLDARLHLLDRQVLDVDGVPVTTVDDLDLEAVDGTDQNLPGERTTMLTAILTGPVLATRVFGGRPPASRWVRLPWSVVTDVSTALHLGVRGTSLDATWTERWVRDHIIARIPGGRHDPG